MPIPTALRTLLKPEDILKQLGIRAGWRVVDCGCGAGYYLAPAARFVGAQGRVVGIDVRSAAVDEARRRVELAGVADRVDVFRADLTRPQASGLPDGWADLVLLVSMLYQSEPRSVLQEAARIAKPADGRVVVIEWEQVATPLGPPPEQRVMRDTVLAAAKAAGMMFLSSFTPSPYQYGLMFVRPQASSAAEPPRRAGNVEV
ncbi:MAG: hypothetical protein G01um101438_822 [Parcubacteria group bacterium Gr01-1014_38]|nr:MAG: hypothetical protein G01um101438_822 [Parcubacteria group bacterium Gr01-1014_38]